MKNQTLISVVLDRSGSMASIRFDMEGGFDSFIREQRACMSDEVRVNLYQFDHEHETVYENRALYHVPRLSLIPRGNTALYDAMGRTINNVGHHLAQLPENERPARVVFLIITDGGENASQEFKQAQVAEMVKHQQEKYNWKFIFLGANQDSFLVAHALNIPQVATMNFAANAVGTQSLYASVASNMRSYRTSNNADALSFSTDQRDAQTQAGALP
jgi:hypothetical protein